MSERTKTITAVMISLIAAVVIVTGLAASTPPASADDRVAALAATIKCPFCNGESLAESGSAVAGEYRKLIADRVEAGLSDEEILAEFATNFGDAAILSTSTSPWSRALWITPAIALLGGVAVIVWLARSAARDSWGSDA